MRIFYVGKKCREKEEAVKTGSASQGSLKQEREDRVFLTIGEALAEAERCAPEPCEIRIGPGVYEENLSITRSGLTMTGAGEGKTVITASLGAKEILADGQKRGTFRTQTVFLHARDVVIRDLTIENTAGPGEEAGQALALCADGDRLLFERVTLTGWQDTLFCGPLPPKEKEPGGFRGPLEHAPREKGRHCYRDCTIVGDVDFIFGGAAAFFENCRIVVRKLEGRQPGLAYITAASTPQGQETGFVFYRCRIEAEGSGGKIFLGRPWREYAKTVFADCELEAEITPEGWDDWGKPHEGLFLAEAGCRGTGASLEGRASFVRQLSARDTERLIREKLPDGWLML